ncbi:MAG: CHAT domain-containing protein [Symploca sp. SIO2E6]|nr:CHAT domain-containing protein [Symploca sp. SIO2E6]
MKCLKTGYSKQLSFLGLILLTFLVVTQVIPVTAQQLTLTPIPHSSQIQEGVISSTEASNLLIQGKTYYDTGRFTEAAIAWQQAVHLYQITDNRFNQALSLNYLCLAYQDLGQWEQAQATINQSLNLLHSSPHPDILAQALNTQGSLQLATGKTEIALKSWQQAETAYAQAEDEMGVLGSKINQAQALQSLGMFQRAQKILEQVEQQLQNQPDSLVKATGWRSLGLVWQTIGNLQQSQQVLEKSLAVARQLNSERDISTTLFSLGNTARGLGETAAALQYYQQATETATNPLSRLEAQLNHLKLLIHLEKFTKAQALIPEIQSNLTNLPISRDSIYAQVNFAVSLIELSSNNQQPTTNNKQPTTNNQQQTTKTIAKILAQAVQQSQTLKDPRAESLAVGNLGKVYEQTDQWSEAQKLTEQALALAQNINARDLTYQWQWQLTRVLTNQGEMAKAIAANQQAFNILQSLRSDLVAMNPEVRFSFQEKIEPIYRNLVSLLLQEDETRGRGDAGTRGWGDGEMGGWGDGEDKENKGDNIATSSSQFPIPNSQFPIPKQPTTNNQQQTTNNNLKQARKIIESLQLAELENFFRTPCLNAKAEQVDTVIEKGDRTAAVVYPIILPDRLAVILSLPGQSLSQYSIKLPQSEVEQTVTRLRQAMNPALSNKQRLKLSQKVYDWLIRPIEKQLTEGEIKTLVFVLDGVLRNVPMAALHDGEQYLIENYSVALTPSLQLLEPRSLQQLQLESLTGGLTEARNGFSALPAVAEEVKQISEKIPSEILLNAQFTRTNLEKQIKSLSVPIVHLATHGQFSSKPEETFLLTWDERLKVNSLSQLFKTREETNGEPIELLVLSACQTANGDKRAALGLAGLAVRSGARSTLATLWTVNDQSTAETMVEFYRYLSQGSGNRAEALRQAQLSLLKQQKYQHPYYWAPFVLVGNWL